MKSLAKKGRNREMTALPLVSFIVLTKNSGNTISDCLESINGIDYPREKFEIIVVDAKSRDETVEIAKQYGCEVVFYEVQGPKCLGITQGAFAKSRNVGLQKTQSEFAAFVDDDAVLSREWLKQLVLKGFEDESVAGATGLNFRPERNSRVGSYVGILPISEPSSEELSALPFANSDFGKPKISQGLDVDFVCGDYMISTKHCIYRAALLKEIGGFDEKTFFGEDTDANARLLKKGYKLAFVPDAKSWHKPRQDLLSFFKQQVRYGLGTAHILEKHPEFSRARWYVPPIALLLTIALAISSLFFWTAALLLACMLVVYLLFLLFYGIRAVKRYKSLDNAIGVPVACFVWQLGWSLGFLYGSMIKRRRREGS